MSACPTCGSPDPSKHPAAWEGPKVIGYGRLPNSNPFHPRCSDHWHAEERLQQLYAILAEATEKAGVGGEGAIVLLDVPANEAHIVLKYEGELDRHGQILVAQKALFALSNYIHALGGQFWPPADR